MVILTAVWGLYFVILYVVSAGPLNSASLERDRGLVHQEDWTSRNPLPRNVDLSLKHSNYYSKASGGADVRDLQHVTGRNFNHRHEPSHESVLLESELNKPAPTQRRSVDTIAQYQYISDNFIALWTKMITGYWTAQIGGKASDTLTKIMIKLRDYFGL